MWATISGFLLKWGFELFIAALTAIGLYFRKEIFEFLEYKKKNKKEAYLKEVYGKINQVTQTSIKEDKKLHEKIDNMEKNIMEILNPLKDAMLSFHLDSLILRCQEFVLQGWITIDDLERIESDYQTYKSLGGNGHMDAWMKRVRTLEIKNKEEQE